MFVEKYEIYHNEKLIKTIGYDEKNRLESVLLAGGETMTIDGVEYNARDLKIKDAGYSYHSKTPDELAAAWKAKKNIKLDELKKENC